MKRRHLLAHGCALGAVSAWSGTSWGQPKEILLGSSLPLTGVIASNAREFREGSRLAFEAANTSGGIQGRRIRVIVLDDAFDRKRVVENAKQLVDQGALCLFGFMGTPGIIEVSPTLTEMQVPLIGAVSGAPALKDPSHRYVFVVRASFATEAAHAVEIGITTGMRSWGVVYQDDGQGRSALQGVTSSLVKHQLKPLIEAAFAPSAAPDFAAIVSRIDKEKPSALVFGGSAPALAAFVKLAKQRSVALPPTTVLSVVSPETAISLLGNDAAGLRFTQPVPYPFSARGASSVEYMKLVKRFSKEPASFIGMEGFLTAKLMIKALEMTPGLQRAKITTTLESMRNQALTDDFHVSYGPQDRTGSRYVDTFIVGTDLKILR